MTYSGFFVLQCRFKCRHKEKNCREEDRSNDILIYLQSRQELDTYKKDIKLDFLGP